MDIYITFYDLSSIYKENQLSIHNGFSFGREKKPGDIDLFFSNNQKYDSSIISDEIKKYNPERIWCSLITTEDLLKVYRIVDARWIIGGPLVSALKNNPLFHNFFIDKSPTFIYTTMEEYLGKSISSDFDPYFLEFVKRATLCDVRYSASIGSGCYWGKCNFCEFKYYENSFFIRGNIEKIIASLLPKRIGSTAFFADLCIQSPPIAVLRRVVDSNINHSNITSYLKVDNNTASNLTVYKDLSDFRFRIGMEGMAQLIIDELNKGFKIDSVIQCIKTLLERNAYVTLCLMEGYSFLSEEVIKEYKNTLHELERINDKHERRLSLSFSGSVFWPKKEDAEKYGFSSEKFLHRELNYGYHTILPKNSNQYKWNIEIRNMLNSSSICYVNEPDRPRSIQKHLITGDYFI